MGAKPCLDGDRGRDTGIDAAIYVPPSPWRLLMLLRSRPAGEYTIGHREAICSSTLSHAHGRRRHRPAPSGSFLCGRRHARFTRSPRRRQSAWVAGAGRRHCGTRAAIRRAHRTRQDRTHLGASADQRQGTVPAGARYRRDELRGHGRRGARTRPDTDSTRPARRTGSATVPTIPIDGMVVGDLELSSQRLPIVASALGG